MLAMLGMGSISLYHTIGRFIFSSGSNPLVLIEDLFRHSVSAGDWNSNFLFQNSSYHPPSTPHPPEGTLHVMIKTTLLHVQLRQGPSIQFLIRKFFFSHFAKEE